MPKAGFQLGLFQACKYSFAVYKARETNWWLKAGIGERSTAPAFSFQGRRTVCSRVLTFCA